jgi:hypothetical protein
MTNELETQLKESNGKAREGKYLVMGARREGGQLAPVMFRSTPEQAQAAAEALTTTGFALAEVYTRVSTCARDGD